MIERWLVTGASGQLGGHVLRSLRADPREKRIIALTRGGMLALDSIESASIALDDPPALRNAIQAHRPTHVLHIGAMTAVGDCFKEPDLARRINTDATRVLAETSAQLDARFIFTSTDMVFDGTAAPYRDDASPSPLSHYGKTKADAEAAALRAGGLVVRIPLLYGIPCTDRPTTFAQQLAALREGRPLTLFTDEFRTPLWLGDAAKALVALARSDLSGMIHVAGPERLSRFDLIARCAALLGITNAQLIPVSRLSIPAAEPRPADLSLDGSNFVARFPELAPKPLRREALSIFSGHLR